MKHLFYLYAIVFILQEIAWVFLPRYKTENNKKFKELSDLNKGKEYKDYSSEFKKAHFTPMFGCASFIWLIGGLFTFQWYIFLIYILLIMILSPLSEKLKFNIGYTLLHWTTAVVGTCVGIFVIINAYHLQIDYKQFFNL